PPSTPTATPSPPPSPPLLLASRPLVPVTQAQEVAAPAPVHAPAAPPPTRSNPPATPILTLSTPPIEHPATVRGDKTAHHHQDWHQVSQMVRSVSGRSSANTACS